MSAVCRFSDESKDLLGAVRDNQGLNNTVCIEMRLTTGSAVKFLKFCTFYPFVFFFLFLRLGRHYSRTVLLATQIGGCETGMMEVAAMPNRKR